MPIRFGDWLRRFLKVMVLAQLVRDVGQDTLYRQADWPLRIGDHRADRHRERLLHLTQQLSEISFAGAVEAACQQDFTR